MKLEPYTLNTLVNSIAAIVKNQEKKVIANQNMHSLYLCMKYPDLYHFINNQSVHVDGMSLIFMANLFGYKLKRENRITYVDLLPKLLEMAQNKKYRVFILGGTKDSNSRGLEELYKRYPNLSLGGHDGYNLDNIISTVNNFNPHILLVGLGMPKQEFWLRDNITLLNCYVALPSGAIIDYVSGVSSTPPRWAGKLGLEWLFRLMCNPRYLWKRYLLEPIYMFLHLPKLIKMFKDKTYLCNTMISST